LTGPLASTFVQVILPVLIIGGIGFALGRVRSLDPGPVTTVAVTALVPAVVFDSLTRPTVSRELLARLALHVLLQLVCLGAVSTVTAALLGWDRPARGALMLATLFSNSGNMGLAISLFAFGPPGLAVAGGWFAVQSFSMQTVGVYIAARARADRWAAVRLLARLPVSYALLAGLVINLAGWAVPTPVARVSQLLGNGSIAVLLLLLGVHLARLAPREELAGASVATAIRLLLAPPVAWLTGRLVGLEGMALAVAVVQASTPAAVTAALWAMEFDARPTLVSAAVVVSTLASVVTLTVLLAVLGAAGAP
jgi:predicted permease